MSEFRIVVLASGSGSLFQALIDNQLVHGTKIVGLICDQMCPAVDRAVKAQIPVSIVELDSNRVTWDEKLAETIADLQPDLIISAGFMRILGPAVLEKFEGKIINTHPALLPNFPGAHAVRDALAANAQVTGSTIHFVDQGMDTGQVISARQVEIFAGDTQDSLHERIKEVERELLVKVVSDFGSGKIKTRSRS